MTAVLVRDTGLHLWRMEWQSTPVFLPGESQGQRSLAGYSPWGCRESDTTERLTHTLGCRMKHNLYTKKLKYSSEHIVIYIELVFLLQPLFHYSLFSSHS